MSSLNLPVQDSIEAPLRTRILFKVKGNAISNLLDCSARVDQTGSGGVRDSRSHSCYNLRTKPRCSVPPVPYLPHRQEWNKDIQRGLACDVDTTMPILLNSATMIILSEHPLPPQDIVQTCAGDLKGLFHQVVTHISRLLILA
jgi:hypothetical protein